MKNSVSVIIPTLNEEKNIINCVNCLINQIEKPVEIIIVDNGSTDNTRTIVESLKNKCKEKKISLRLFYYPIGNQTNAREFGVRKAKANIIGSLDAEAHASRNWILKINNYFKDKNIVGIGGKSSYRNRGRIFNFFYVLNYYLRLILNLYCIGGGNSAFRKSTFFSVKGYKGLEKLRKEKKILFAKDDYFLSKKLEKIGKLKFCSDLNVSLLYRLRNRQTKVYKNDYSIQDILKRLVLEIVYDYKISSYFKK